MSDMISYGTKHILDPLADVSDKVVDALLKMLQRGSRETVIDHWHGYMEDFHVDPLEFYELVFVELRKRQIPGFKSFCVTHGEGTIGSADRLYLRLDRDWGKFDICAAPFGTGFFFSYRYIIPTPLGIIARLILGILIIGAAMTSFVWFGYSFARP